MNIKNYRIIDEIRNSLYSCIRAEYIGDPSKCPNEECQSIYFTHHGNPAEHKICIVHNNMPVVMSVTRARLKCKSPVCGRTFYADYEETQDWENDISPNFRNRVINYWIRNKDKSIYAASLDFGIDQSLLTKWENTLADTFYRIQKIGLGKEIYIGAFRVRGDEAPHAFIASIDENFSFLSGFIRNYTSEGLLSEIETRIETEFSEEYRYQNREDVKIVRYDYIPGIREALREVFPNAQLAVNRRELFFTLVAPITKETSSLSRILHPTTPVSRDVLTEQLTGWIQQLDVSDEVKADEMKIVTEVTDDIFNAINQPKLPSIINTTRQLIDKLAGKKASFNTVMLKVMYNNEQWKQKIQEAGDIAGFTFSFMGGMNNSRRKSSWQFSGEEEVLWYEVDEKDLERLLAEETEDTTDYEQERV